MPHVPAPPAAASKPALRRSRWRADALLVLLLALGCYALSSAIDLSERVERWLARSEGWQADELPLTLTALAVALTWFAWRRRNETLAELRLRESAEARVQGLLSHNRELARQLIGVQESERRALARELHDDLGQACSAIRVETAFIRHCNGGAHAGIAAAAERAEAEAQRLYEQVRDMLRRLRPVELDALGLLAALQALCEAWEARSGVACSFHHEGLATALGDAVDITVYRVTQEALSNVMRHAMASSVRVRLQCSTQELVLTVHDDGCGVDPGASPTRGLGLLGASERAAALGGRLHIESTPGAGLRLELQLPLGGASSHADEGIGLPTEGCEPGVAASRVRGATP
jgi:two-component system sensor histidine kinase UhpB